MKKKRTVQVTITVPRGLRSDMIDYSNRYKVNWSKIACKAFAKYLEVHNVQKPKEF